MQSSRLKHWLLSSMVACALLSVQLKPHAEAVFDNSLGRGTTPNRLSGKFEVPYTRGELKGSNLFHSFQTFHVRTGESATFTGPAKIDNVISRVTGKGRSSIDGPLRSTIPSANLWFINPHGVLFGKNASLDVDGSFHVSTADYLKLGKGGRFDATHPKESSLTSAPPEAFGFLGRNPAGISIHESVLTVPEGKTLSIVGGDLDVSGGELGIIKAPSGRINLASVGSAGDVVLGETGLDTSSFTFMGSIALSENAFVDTSGKEGGAIYIRGGELLVDNAFVVANTEGAGGNHGVDIDIQGKARISNGSIIQAAGLTNSTGKSGDLRIQADKFEVRNGSELSVITTGGGKGGDLIAKAQDVLLSGDGSKFFTGISAQAAKGSTGAAGNVMVKAGKLTVHDGAAISAGTSGKGRGGDLHVEATNIKLSGDGSELETGITSSAESIGAAGDISVKAGKLTVQNKAVIGAGTFARGPGGDVHVEAANIALLGDGTGFLTGITAQANPDSTGPAGDVTVKAGSLTVRKGAAITASTWGKGAGGDVRVEATNIELVGDGAEFLTGIAARANPGSTGPAGDVMVEAGRLTVRDGGAIAANTSGPGRGGDLRVKAGEIELSGEGSDFFTGIIAGAISGSTGAAGNVTVEADSLRVHDRANISAATFGTGPGGDISITATDIELSNNGGILALSLTPSIRAVSGDIVIQAKDSLRIFDSSKISVETSQANAGNINIHAGDLLHLRDDSSITTSVAGGEGSGGNITIDPTFVVLDGGSKIVAQAKRGSGGNINITADFLFQSPDSLIDASSEFGQSGTVTVNSPDTNILGGITMLPETFFDAAALMRQHCAARATGGRSSLVLQGSGIEIEPGATYLPAYLLDIDGPNAASRSTKGAAIDKLNRPSGGVTLKGRAWGCGRG